MVWGGELPISCGSVVVASDNDDVRAAFLTGAGTTSRRKRCNAWMPAVDVHTAGCRRHHSLHGSLQSVMCAPVAGGQGLKIMSVWYKHKYLPSRRAPVAALLPQPHDPLTNVNLGPQHGGVCPLRQERRPLCCQKAEPSFLRHASMNLGARCVETCVFYLLCVVNFDLLYTSWLKSRRTPAVLP